MSRDPLEAPAREAARALREASALVIAAGAGMGVDSGLPDFRGDEGFWNAYPAFKHLGLRFVELANPRWFRNDPALAWGFYGHRLDLYRRTAPHEGFAILLRWASSLRHGAFVFTSNVDGHFQKAGFADDRIVECHGSFALVQCRDGCGAPPASASDLSVEVDLATFRAREPLPLCPGCGAVSRPNILMFGDFGWDGRRTEEQEERLDNWLAEIHGPFVIVELGAGLAVPSVRFFSERLASSRDATLIRINPRDAHDGGESVSRFLPFSCGALDGLRAIDAALRDR